MPDLSDRALRFLKSKRAASLGIIVIAALLVELISIVQYYQLQKMVREDLEIRSGIILGALADNIGNTLESTEATMRENRWVIKRSIADPDSVFNSVVHLIEDNPNVVGGCIAFIPDYYPSKGRLFEPYASKENGIIRTEQIAGPDHDYTQNPTFREVLETNAPSWTDPYLYGPDSSMSLTTYSYPITDDSGRVIAVCGLDMDLSWLGDTLNVRQPYPSSFTVMLTSDGRLVAGPPESWKRDDDVRQVVDMVNKSDSAPVSPKLTIRSTSLEKEPHWRVVQAYDTDEVYAPVRRIRFRQFFMILAGLLILFFMIERYARNEKRLLDANVKQARIGSELAIARRIQTEMLPKSFPSSSDRKGVDISGSLVPAREVGGDIFDFFFRDGNLIFCIGDVSGKGVPAAMLMAVLHSLFKMIPEHEVQPVSIVTVLNRELCSDNESNMFVTFFLGVLNLSTGKLDYCNAGHDRPMLVSDSVTELSVHSNLPLGVFGDTVFEAQELLLEPGSTLFLYTDGLTEARDLQRRQFTRKRVLDVLDRCRNVPECDSDHIVEEMNAEVHRFTEGAEQSDDMTMLAIRFVPESTSPHINEKISLKNDVQEIKKLGAFVKAVSERLDVTGKTASNLRLALEEVVVNVISYAYPEGVEGDVSVSARSDGSQIEFTVTDSGVPFDPTAVSPADTSLDAGERPLGGLGIHIARKLMDTVSYERSGINNVLTLKKTIS